MMRGLPYPWYAHQWPRFISDLLQHLLNSVFALFEITLTNTPAAAFILLPFGVVLLLGYVGIVYITYATQGFYGTSALPSI
jgi:hypothetical protein